MKRRT